MCCRLMAKNIKNKKDVNNELQKDGATQQEAAIVNAIAQTETTHMSVQQRDGTKSGSSTNYGIYNINLDLAKQIDSSLDLNSLNQDTPEARAAATKLTLQGIRKLGVNPFLNENRAGSAGANVGNGDCQYDCKGYRDNVYGIANQILKDPLLLTDNRRVNTQLTHY